MVYIQKFVQYYRILKTRGWLKKVIAKNDTQKWSESWNSERELSWWGKLLGNSEERWHGAFFSYFMVDLIINLISEFRHKCERVENLVTIFRNLTCVKPQLTKNWHVIDTVHMLTLSLSDTHNKHVVKTAKSFMNS